MQWIMRFADYQCLRIRLGAKEISQSLYDELEMQAKSGGEPDAKLLTICLPYFVPDLHKFAVNTGRLHDMWSANTVFGYWRIHKGMGPGCQTISCLVTGYSHLDHPVMVSIAGKPFEFKNPHGLQLFPDTRVLAHQRYIAAWDSPLI